MDLVQNGFSVYMDLVLLWIWCYYGFGVILIGVIRIITRPAYNRGWCFIANPCVQVRSVCVCVCERERERERESQKCINMTSKI